MTEPALTPEHSDHSTSGSDLPPNTLFWGRYGLRPVWRLLLYLAIVLTPVMLMMIADQLAGEPAPTSHNSIHEISPLMMALTEWMQFGFIFFATWIMSRIEDRNVVDYGLPRIPHRVNWMICGVLLGLVAQSLLVAVLWSTHHLVIAGVLLRPTSAVAYGLFWAFGFVGVAFFEEFLFRGYLQFALTETLADLVRFLSPANRYVEAISFWSAAVMISFGFGLLHKMNSGESPIGLLCAGCAGLMFAFCLWRTGSLWWAIGLHAAWDWVQSFLFGVPDSGGVSAHRLLSTHLVGPAWLSGGETGPEGSIFVLAVMVVILLIAASTLPHTRTSFLAQEEMHLTPEVNSAKG